MDGLALETANSQQHALVMAGLADGRSHLAQLPPDDQTQAVIDGLLGLGVAVVRDEGSGRIDVAGTGGYWPNSDAELHAGDSFATTCLLIAACSLGRGQYTVISALPPGPRESLVTLLSALVDLRATLNHESVDERLVVNVGPEPIRGGTIRLPMGCPPAVLDSLLLIAPYAVTDVMIESRGRTADAVDRLLPMMELFGVSVFEDGGRFVVEAPQRYRGQEVTEWS